MEGRMSERANVLGADVREAYVPTPFERIRFLCVFFSNEKLDFVLCEMTRKKSTAEVKNPQS